MLAAPPNPSRYAESWDARPPDVMKNLLVSVDFSDITDLVVDRAAKIAAAFGSTIRLVHVAPPDPAFASSRGWPQEVRDELAKELFGEHDILEELAEGLEERGIHAKALIDRGSVVESILDIASRTDTDLIILGSRSHGALFKLAPRSVVKGIISRSTCPVMVIPQPKLADAETERELG